MISANGVEYKNLPEQVQYLTERAAEFAVELDRVSASVESVAGDVAALQTSYTTLAEDVRVAKININSLFTNVGTAFSEITNIKDGTTPLFETITDSHGNPRFIEGDITMDPVTGVTQTYGKWSLSGTHLMIVIGATATNGSTLPVGLRATVNVPDYIKDKVRTLTGIKPGYVEYKTILAYNTSAQTQAFSIVLILNSVNELVIASGSNVTFTDNRSFRIQFDLLIDAS